MKRFWVRLIVMGLAVLLGQSALVGAQGDEAIDDIVMEFGDSYMLYLPPDGVEQVVRVVAEADADMWFLIDGTRNLQIAVPVLEDGAGDSVAYEGQQQDQGVYRMNVVAPSDGTYRLRLFTEAGARGGYLRVVYDASPPLPFPAADASTLMDAPLDEAWRESFGNTDRPWWTGEAEGGTAQIAESALQMAPSAGGQLVSGFNQVPGTDDPYHYIETTVRVDGNPDDAVFGLMYQVVDAANYAVFQVLPERAEWRVMALEDGEWSPLMNWAYDPRLMGDEDPHRMAIWVLNDVQIFIWDDQPLGHTEFSSEITGGVGLLAELPPNSPGQPLIWWDDVWVGVMPPGVSWGVPVLPPQVRLEPGSDGAPMMERPQPLAQQLIGTWYWNDTADTQAMTLLFNADGSFTQSITALDADAIPQDQFGTWYVREDETLVIALEGLPEQRYRPTVTRVTLTIPELGNRTFVRLVE